MPKMTRETFPDMVGGLFALAQRNLTRDGFVHQVLLGLDARGQMALSVLSVSPEAYDKPEEHAEAASIDTLILPGPLPAHTDVLAAACQQRRVVAAVHIVEMWLVSGAAAQDVLAREMRPSEHPDRQEGVLVVGRWPQQLSTAVLAGKIVRDGSTPILVPWAADEVAAGSSQPIIDWLDDLLPGLPGRR